MANRFLVFGFDGYQAQGGWGDFIAAFDSIEDAVKAVNDHAKDLGRQYYHIIDLKRLENVWEI